MKKSVTIRLDEKLHRAARALAASRGVSLSKILNDLLQNYVGSSINEDTLILDLPPVPLPARSFPPPG